MLGPVKQYTRTELLAKMAFFIEDMNERWSAEQQLDAVNRGYLACLPLGVKQAHTATGAGEVWVVPAFLSQPLDYARARAEFRGVMILQALNPAAIRVTQQADGSSELRLPYALDAAATLEVAGFTQLPLPASASAVIPFPWGDLLVTFALAELCAMKQDHGANVDIQQFADLAMRFKQEAIAMKLDILRANGMLPDMPEGSSQKKPSSKKG